MGLKKRSGASTTEGGSSRKKRKEEVTEEVKLPEVKKSRKAEVFKPKEEIIPMSDEELVERELQDYIGPEDITWPQKDMLELFRRIENQVPEDDSKAFSTRSARLDWEEIAFNNYTPKECRQVWDKVTKKIRRFRILKEMIGDARHWVQKPWQNFYSGSKRQNHPDMPRRPLSQYMLYYMEKKDKVAEQHPELIMTDVSKLIADMYNGLPDSKKMKYVRKAVQLREEYEEKMRLFYEKHPDLREEKAPKKNTRNVLATTDIRLGCPKPRCPRMIYLEDILKRRETDPGYDKEMTLQEARLQWKDLSEKMHLFYINLALEEEKKYLDALKQYCEENPNYEPPPYKTVLKKDEIFLKQKAAGKPVKPASSGYSLYSRIMLAECPELRELPPSSRMQEISVRWGQMSDTEKNEYAKRVKYDQEQYKLDYATYLESLTEEERNEELLNTQLRQRPNVKPRVTAVEVKDKKNSNVIKTDTSKAKSKSTNKEKQSNTGERKYYPGEPTQPPVNAYDLFLESFLSDTKLSASEAPRYWAMLPRPDKAKFQRKLKELKDQYMKDFEQFLKSLDQDELSLYNDLQRRNKAIELKSAPLSEDDDDDEVDSSSDEEQADSNEVENDQEDSDSDEDEAKKSDSSSGSSSSSSNSSSSSSSSSSSEDSDSSSDDSEDDDAEGKKTKVNCIKKESTDSDSSDD